MIDAEHISEAFKDLHETDQASREKHEAKHVQIHDEEGFLIHIVHEEPETLVAIENAGVTTSRKEVAIQEKEILAKSGEPLVPLPIPPIQLEAAGETPPGLRDPMKAAVEVPISPPVVPEKLLDGPRNSVPLVKEEPMVQAAELPAPVKVNYFNKQPVVPDLSSYRPGPSQIETIIPTQLQVPHAQNQLISPKPRNQNEMGVYETTFMHITMIVIVSYQKNFEKRQNQRNTWIKQLPPNFEYKFLFGNSDSVSWEQGERERFDAELLQHTDMIVANEIEEGYRKIPVKVFWGIEWAAKLANKPKYIIKTDDDIDPQVPMMLDMLESRPTDETFAYYGYVYDDKRPNRDIKSQWFISYDLYPSDEILPPYACGAWYFMTSDLALLVAEEFHKPGFPRNFPFEDILMGIAVKNAGYKPESNNNLFYCDRALSTDPSKEMFVHPAPKESELNFKKKE